MYKIINNESPLIMKQVFSSTNNPYNLRNNNPFTSTNVHSVYYGTETDSYRGPQIWATVPVNIKNWKSTTVFKKKIRTWKPIDCPARICKLYIPNIGFV